MVENSRKESWFFFTAIAGYSDVQLVLDSLKRVGKFEMPHEAEYPDEQEYRFELVRRICGCSGTRDRSYTDFLQSFIAPFGLDDEYRRYAKNAGDSLESMEDFLMSYGLGQYVRICEPSELDRLRKELGLVNNDREALAKEIQMKTRTSRSFNATLPILLVSGSTTAASAAAGLFAGAFLPGIIGVLSGPLGMVAGGVFAATRLFGGKRTRKHPLFDVTAALLPTLYILIRIRRTADAYVKIDTPAEAVQYVTGILRASTDPEKTAMQIRRIIEAGEVRSSDPLYSATDYRIFLRYADDIKKIVNGYCHAVIADKDLLLERPINRSEPETGVDQIVSSGDDDSFTGGLNVTCNPDSHEIETAVSKVMDDFERLREQELRSHEKEVARLKARILDLEREVASGEAAISLSKASLAVIGEGTMAGNPETINQMLHDEQRHIDRAFETFERDVLERNKRLYESFQKMERNAVRRATEAYANGLPGLGADVAVKEYGEEMSRALDELQESGRTILRGMKEKISSERSEWLHSYYKVASGKAGELHELQQLQQTVLTALEEDLSRMHMMHRDVEQKVINAQERLTEEVLQRIDRLAESYDRLKKSLEESEEKNRIYDMMLHGIRHNLAPIFANAMRPYKDYIAYPEDGFPVDDVQNAVRNGETVVSVLKKAGLSDHSAAEPVNLSQSVRDVFGQDCLFTVSYDEDFPENAVIMFDRDSLMAEVLNNVRTNIEDHAFGHYSEEVRPVSSRHVHISLSEKGGFWTLSVSNDGDPFPGGIDPRKVFEYGTYYDDSNSKERGTGMFFLERAVSHFGGKVEFLPIEANMYTVEYRITFKKQ